MCKNEATRIFHLSIGYKLQPNNLNILFDALSIPRVASYRHYFGHHLSDEEIFGCYQWNESISHAFFKVITLIEIVMRNKMHSSLSAHYHGHTKKVVQNTRVRPWLPSNINTIGSQQSCNWYHSFSNGDWILNYKSLSKINDKTHHHRNGSLLTNHRAPSSDDIVSSLTFGFWSSLVEKCPKVDWGVILVNIFPKHRASNSNQWGSEIERKKLTFRLNLIRDFRNRIAHHEPVWKLGNYYSEQPTIRNGRLSRNQSRQVLDGATTTPQESIRRLRSIYSRHTELLRWLSKEIYKDFTESSLHKNLLWLCSADGLEAHLNRKNDTQFSMKPCKFKREISSILKGKKAAYLHKNGRNVIAIQHIT